MEKNREKFKTIANMLVFWLREQWIKWFLECGGAESELTALLDNIEKVDRAYRAVVSNANFSLTVNAMLY
jgi:hypothetical protein